MSKTGLGVLVVGGGVGGLGSACAVRAGHRVTLERDSPGHRRPRRGVPPNGAGRRSRTRPTGSSRAQVLRDRFPDVLDDLLALGCTTMSTTANLGEPRPGDEDLAVLIVRRTTLDWVLRRAVLAQSGVEVRTGVAVTGLVADRVPPGAGRRPSGVRLRDGGVLEADLVVVAGGRRSPLPAWLADTGVAHPRGGGRERPDVLHALVPLPEGPQSLRDPKLGGDLGYLKFLGVPGDGETLSVTLAVATRDGELRAALAAADRFDLACRLLPGPDGFFADGPLEPLGGVKPMGGLLNRLRRFVDDGGRPLVLGVHAVGDAHTWTNPSTAGAGTLAMVQAVLLADALADHPDDPPPEPRPTRPRRRRGRALVPLGAGAGRAGADPTGRGRGGGLAGSEQGRAMAAVFVAAATDPVIGRAMVRFWNLLVTLPA